MARLAGSRWEGNMIKANSKEVEVAQTNQDRARAAVQLYHAKPDERNDPRFNHVPRRPHLDVDAVLARSLPKVTGE
jgi:hypothetical protein